MVRAWKIFKNSFKSALKIKKHIWKERFSWGRRKNQTKEMVITEKIAGVDLKKHSSQMLPKATLKGEYSAKNVEKLFSQVVSKYNISENSLSFLNTLMDMTGTSPADSEKKNMRKVKLSLKNMNINEIKRLQNISRVCYNVLIPGLHFYKKEASEHIQLANMNTDEILNSRIEKLEERQRIKNHQKEKERQKPERFIYHPKKDAMTRGIENLLKIRQEETFVPELRKVIFEEEFTKTHLKFLFDVTKRIAPGQLSFLPYYLQEKRHLTALEKKFFKEKGLL